MCFFLWLYETMPRTAYEKGVCMGYPYFNPPGTQKVNTIEQGHYFVPTAGIEPESVKEEENIRWVKIKRAVKIVAIVLGAIVFVIGGCWAVVSTL